MFCSTTITAVLRLTMANQQKPTFDQLKEAFFNFDVDRDGAISTEDLKVILMSKGNKMDRAEVRLLRIHCFWRITHKCSFRLMSSWQNAILTVMDGYGMKKSANIFCKEMIRQLLNPLKILKSPRVSV